MDVLLLGMAKAITAGASRIYRSLALSSNGLAESYAKALEYNGELALKPRAQMNKQTVTLIALFVGWILTADIANATTYDDIAGQWCGDVTAHVFAPNTLTVKFSRRQTGQCVKDHEIHLHQRQRTYRLAQRWQRVGHGFR